MRWIVATLMASACAGVACAQGLPEWVTTEKLRGAFIQDWGSFDLDAHLKKLSEAGFNAVIPTHGYAPGMAGQIERFKDLSDAYGLHYVASQHVFRMVQRYKNEMGEKYPAMILKDGTKGALPSIVDPGFWEITLTNAVTLAKAGLSGVVFDLEAYGYYDQQYLENPDVSDMTMRAFAAACKPAAGVLERVPEDRWGWIEEQGLGDEYYAVMEAEVGKIAARLRDQVRAVNPEFLLGILLTPKDWFFRGFVKGLGAPEFPALYLPEHTYRSGYGERARAVIDFQDDPQLNALCCPGVELNKNTPLQMAEACWQYFGHARAGYWIYTTFMLTPEAQASDMYRVPEPYTVDEYWRVLALLNAELVRSQQAGPGAPGPFHKLIALTKQNASFFDEDRFQDAFAYTTAVVRSVQDPIARQDLFAALEESVWFVTALGYRDAGETLVAHALFETLAGNCRDATLKRNAQGELFLLGGDPVPGKMVYKAKPCSSAPVIDGRLDDPAWREAAETEGFVNYWKGDNAKLRTTAQLTYDEANLYIAFAGYDPQMDRLRAEVTMDDGNVWVDDSFEVFVDANLDYRTYHHLIVNSLGVQWDGSGAAEYQSGKATDDPSWNAETERAVARRDDRWTLELAIPLEELGVAEVKPGAVWGVNLARARQSKPGSSAEQTCWSCTNGNHLQPGYFGYVLFEPGES